ncbi:MAG: PDZ domain-containing protein [Lacibacter sp.]|jgi:serine protease Do
MKRITFKAALLLLALQLGVGSLSFAQKREKAERIIIQKKGDKNEKTVIEIDGDKVKVNGKEIKEGEKDGNIIIREFDDKDVYLHMPRVYERMMPLLQEELMLKQRDWQHKSKQWEQKSRELERRMEGMKLKMEKRAFLGVSTDEVSNGLKITEVSNESAAAAAGLKEGDIITNVDGKEMKESEQLVEAIRAHKPGDEVSIEYLRNGKKQTTTATLKSLSMPESFQFRMDPIEIPDFQFDGLREMRIMPPLGGEGFQFYKRGPKLGATIQDTEDGKGVTVDEVDADAPAAKNGLQKGDVITEINGKAIADVGDARDAMREATDKNTWSIKVQRGGKPVTIEVKIPKELKKAELEP